MAVSSCMECGKSVGTPGRGRPRKWCDDHNPYAWIRSARSRDPEYWKNSTCTGCGASRGESHSFTARDGQGLCSTCRYGPPRISVDERACAWCLDIFAVRYPSATHCGASCAQRHAASKRGRSQTRAGKARRSDRERLAPGLTYTQRRELLKKWRTAGARCVYCPALATTTDHLIPLSRGGTNYEGNLAPCCKRCNSSKSDLLTSEWRWGKPHGGTVSPSPWLMPHLYRLSAA